MQMQEASLTPVRYSDQALESASTQMLWDETAGDKTNRSDLTRQENQLFKENLDKSEEI